MNTVYYHDYKPSHRKEQLPEYLRAAKHADIAAWQRYDAVIDMYTDGNASAETLQAARIEWEAAMTALNAARERYNRETAEAYAAQDADWQDEQAMYQDLRHGG